MPIVCLHPCLALRSTGRPMRAGVFAPSRFWVVSPAAARPPPLAQSRAPCDRIGDHARLCFSGSTPLSSSVFLLVPAPCRRWPSGSRRMRSVRLTHRAQRARRERPWTQCGDCRQELTSLFDLVVFALCSCRARSSSLRYDAASRAGELHRAAGAGHQQQSQSPGRGRRERDDSYH
jgi:hypothetical protein